MTRPQGKGSGGSAARLCLTAAVSRASYYRHWAASAPKAEETELRDLVQRLAIAHRHYGYRRITELVRREGWPANHKRIARIMGQDINSPEGRAAALEATSKGLPALAGVDRMLQVALGSDYGSHNMGTATAGGIVASLMRAEGYRKVGQRPMPADCVARSAVTWTVATPGK